MKDLQAIAEDVELAERFAVALRFHGQPERAEHYEHLAAEIREEVTVSEPCEVLA